MSLAWATLAAATLAATPPQLEAAQKAFDELKFDRAAALLQEVAQLDGLSRADARDYFLLDGLVRASRNDAEGAQKSFTAALVIVPATQLPGKAAPRITTPFLEAKSWLNSHGPLALEVDSSVRGPDGWTVAFKPPRDDAGLVRDVRLVIVEDGAPREQTWTAGAPVTVRGRKASVVWTLRGVHGWVLHEGGPLDLRAELEPEPMPVAASPAPVTTAPATAPAPLTSATPQTGRTFPLWPGITLLGAGAASTIAGMVLLLGGSSELLWLPLTVGGLGAIGGGIAMIVVSNRSVRVEASLVPGKGGVGFVVRGSFW